MNKSKPLGYMLGQTLKVYKTLTLASFKAYRIDLSFEQFIVLMLLSLEDNLNQQNIANQMQRDKSLILRYTNVLIEKGYVVRVPDEGDKRRKKLVLTPKGLETSACIKKTQMKVEEQLIAGIGQDELNTLTRILTRIQLNGGIEDEQSLY